MNIRIMAVACLAASWTVCADTYTWSPTSGTLFQETANWSPSTGVPGAADTAVFSGANTYAVTFNGNVTNVDVTIGSPVAGTAAAFDLNGRFWKITGALGFGATGNAGTATFGNGALEVSNAVAVKTSQKLVLNNETSIFNKTLSTAGGTVEVGGGTHVFGRLSTTDGTTGLTLGAPPSGGTSLRLTNGTVCVQGQLYGSGGAKALLQGGMLLVTNGAYGVVIEGPATVDVNTNAMFNNSSGRFYLGRLKGQTVLNILGGVVTNTGATMQIGSSYAPGSTGIVNLVDGLFYSSQLVGFGGTTGFFTNSVGILQQTGGRVHIATTLQLGYCFRSMGIYTQSGGTAWCNELRMGNINGSGSQGLVYLAGGTLALNSTPYLGNGVNCTGCIYQTGGELLVSNGVSIGVITNSSGLFSYAGGKAWINGSVYVGNAAGASGRMIVDGSELDIKGSLNVGYAASSTGELEIAGGTLALEGGSETSPKLGVALGSGSVGRVVKTGGDLRIGPINVGSAANSRGDLVISGGTLTVTNQYALIVGGYASEIGAVGRVEISGGTNCFADARIGHKAFGLLRVTGGQTYVTNAANYSFSFGNSASGTGRLELAGGTLTVRSIYGNAGYAEVLCDGGVLQCACDSTSFFYWFDLATLTDRGAVIDTDGHTVSLSQTLANEPGYAGAFTKRGAGTLTLASGDNAFTGRVAVEAGELLAGSGGRIYLNGGVAINAGAVLDVSAGSLRGFTTDSGTVSRIDGALVLRAIEGTLTNGVGATLCGGGVVTGSVVFASGSAWAHDKAWGTASAGPLRVTGNSVIEEGVTVALTGYSVDDLKAGVPLVEAVGTGTLQVPGLIPVTLDGVSHRYWWAKVSNDGKTLTAAFIPMGTMIRLL